MTHDHPDPPFWRSVADDPPPDGMAVETCVRGKNGDRLHLPLRRTYGRWYGVDFRPFLAWTTPTHWRPLA